MSPHDSLCFTVMGSDEAELRIAAAKQIAAFVVGGSKWDFYMSTKPLATEMGGRVMAWQAEVEAWRVSA